MEFKIPVGWRRVTGATIQAGDRIKTADGWASAINLGKPGKHHVSTVGHPTDRFECVIRREKPGE
jgi:sorbitol-specific phosphotransferase system component IIA